MNIQNIITSEKQRRMFAPGKRVTTQLMCPPASESVYAFAPLVLTGEPMTFEECHKRICDLWNSIPVYLVTSEMNDDEIDVPMPDGTIGKVQVYDRDYRIGKRTFHASSFGAYVTELSNYEEKVQYILIFVDILLDEVGKKKYAELLFFVLLREMTRALLGSDDDYLVDSLALVFYSAINGIDIEEARSDVKKVYSLDFNVLRRRETSQAILQKSLNWMTNRAFSINDLEDERKIEWLYRFCGGFRKICIGTLISYTVPKCDYIEADFLGCFDGITSLEIPEGVEYIEDGTIHHCSSLTSVTLPSTLKVLEPGAIQYCPNIKHLSVHPDNEEYYSKDNCILCRKDNSLEVGCASSIIPDGIAYIDHNAFLGCSELRSITLPESIVVIGVNAFCGTGIESIVIPSGVESIQCYAFTECENLKSVIFKGSPVLSHQSFAHYKRPITFTSESTELIISDRYAFAETEECATFNFPGGMRKIWNVGVDDVETSFSEE